MPDGLSIRRRSPRSCCQDPGSRSCVDRVVHLGLCANRRPDGRLVSDESAERWAPAGRGEQEVQWTVAVQRDRLSTPSEAVAERLAQRPAGKPVRYDLAYGADCVTGIHPGVGSVGRYSAREGLPVRSRSDKISLKNIGESNIERTRTVSLPLYLVWNWK